MLTCPGNHDVREPYESVLLGRAPSGGAVNEAHDVAGVLVAMCDSSRPGRADGLLDQPTLDWLDATLAAAADRPALVCFHHPPTRMHQPMIDAILLTDPDRLAAVLDRHPHVAAVLTATPTPPRRPPSPAGRAGSRPVSYRPCGSRPSTPPTSMRTYRRPSRCTCSRAPTSPPTTAPSPERCHRRSRRFVLAS